MIAVCREYNIPYFILGNGSNLLVSDDGYRGIIINIMDNMDSVTVDGRIITAQAGAMLVRVSVMARDNALTGLEFASGIPGTIGGAVYMNAGAYGGEMKNVVKTVRAIDEYGRIYELDSEKMDFSYRHSIVEERKLIVLEVTLELEHGSREAIDDRMKELAEARRSKQPLEYPSAGSIFSANTFSNTSFATPPLITLSSTSLMSFARFSAENFRSSASTMFSFISLMVSPISQLDTFFAGDPSAMASSNRSAIFFDAVIISIS